MVWYGSAWRPGVQTATWIKGIMTMIMVIDGDLRILEDTDLMLVLNRGRYLMTWWMMVKYICSDFDDDDVGCW